MNLGAPFACFVVAVSSAAGAAAFAAAGFFVGAGVTCLPGGASVAVAAVDAAGRGGAWVVGCFVAESYCMLDADLGGVTKGVGLHVCT